MQRTKEYENQTLLTGGFLISFLISWSRLILPTSFLSLISRAQGKRLLATHQEHLFNLTVGESI